uniref:Failed axon connections homolog n=1 Tax=Plectus sambesii TaxID=2011161 RepID=A0A914VZ42_9BILA
MGRSQLMKPEFDKDMVYLVQIPRAGCIPSLSPFCLKLETWLRMAGIRYQNIDNKLTNNSSKGQIPFVELNGRELNDTNFIIGELTQYFSRESMEMHLNTEQAANLHSYLRMTEESLRWVVVVERSKNGEIFITDQVGMGRQLSCPKKFFLRIIGIRFLKRGLKGSVQKQGYGRFSEDELNAVAKSDLKALDGFLGKKRFFFGDRPTRLDASVFGVVGELLYAPSSKDTIQKFIQLECPNLSGFMERVKVDFWPDWEEILKTGAMNTAYNDSLQQDRGYSNPALQDTTTKL